MGRGPLGYGGLNIHYMYTYLSAYIPNMFFAT